MKTGEILLQDARHAAFHEAGHAVFIARYSGNVARCEIFRHAPLDSLEKSVIGKAGYETYKLHDWSEQDKCTMAMAGEISTLISGGEDDSFTLEDFIYDVWTGDAVSETDRAAAGRNWEQHAPYAISQCLECWQVIKEVAERLIERFCADGQKANVTVFVVQNESDEPISEGVALPVLAIESGEGLRLFDSRTALRR